MRGRTACTAALVLSLACGDSRASAVTGEGVQPGPREPVGLEVRVMDGLSGGPVHGVGVVFVPGTGRRIERKLPVPAHGNRFVLEDTGFVRGERSAHSLELKLPPGWVREKEEYDPMPPVVTLLTRKVARTVVVWPEADIQVRVVKADGAPAAGATLFLERLGEREREEWLAISHHTHRSGFPDVGEGTTAEDGTGRVTGAPSVPGARYRVRAWWGDRSAVSETVTLLRGTESASLTVRLPEKVDSDFGSSGGGSGTFACFPGLGEPARGEGSVRVEVQWSNGEPARGVCVFLDGAAAVPLAREGFYAGKGWRKFARTGQDGFALFEGVPEGKAAAWVSEPGFVRGTPAAVDSVSGKVQVVRLREGLGRGVVVRLLNSSGEGVPGAELQVIGGEEVYSWVDASGVQQVGPMTGAGGLAFLPRVPSGELQVRAVLGTRSRLLRIAGERAEAVLPDE